MKIIKRFGWVYYLSEDFKSLDEHKCGKWMYFFADKNYAEELCKKAINEDIVVEAKHTDNVEGVICFYLNCDDFCRHKKTIDFFLKNNLIRKTKSGKLYNIAFKLDDQTRAREYGSNFKAEIKLENFLNLTTGEWIYKNEQ